LTTTVRRKPGSARKAAAQADNARKVRQAKEAGGSLLDRLVGWLPLGEVHLYRLVVALTLAVGAVLVWMALLAAGVPAIAAGQVARIAADAGFEVKRVDVRGTRNLNDLKVYEKALSAQHRSMTQVDLEGLRQDLLTLPWVKDARVSRQLPDGLVIDIVERTPHAVLRKPGGRFMLIDDEGRELDVIAPDRVAKYMIVSGPGSAQRAVELDRLMMAAPALRPQVREAEWIGNRRWNLTFRTSQVLALPEGDKDAADALVTFARLDGTKQLIGGTATVFDMRSPDRIYFRVPGSGDADAAAAAAAKRAQNAPRPAAPKENT
jgi:cell division protein FtsQ